MRPCQAAGKYVGNLASVPKVSKPRGSVAASSDGSPLKPTPPNHPPPAVAPPILGADANDSGEWAVLDRVLTPTGYAELMQAYHNLGRVLNSIPVRPRD